MTDYEYRCTAIDTDGSVGPDFGCGHRRCAERAGVPIWECPGCGAWFLGTPDDWTDRTCVKEDA